MALFQSKAVKSRRGYPATGFQVGQVMAAVYEHTFTEAFTAASDILEIGLLPSGAKPIRATLISGDLGAGVTATLSLMTGTAGEPDAARVAETDIQDTIAAHSTSTPLSVDALTDVAVEEKHRGLGLEFSGNITAGATKTVKLVFEYHF